MRVKRSLCLLIIGQLRSTEQIYQKPAMKSAPKTLLQFSLIFLALMTLSQQFDLHKCCPEGFLLNGNFSTRGRGPQLQQCIRDTRAYKTYWYPQFINKEPPHNAIPFNKIVPKSMEDRMKHIYSRCTVHQLLSTDLQGDFGKIHISNQGVFEYEPARLRFTGAEFCVDSIQRSTGGGLKEIITCPCFRRPRLCRN